MMNAQQILDNSELLVKSDCIIYDDRLYERCTFDDNLFTRDMFKNTDDETYTINDNNYVYRVFLSEDDYDYVTDAELIQILDSKFS